MKTKQLLIGLFMAGLGLCSLSSCRFHCVHGSGNQVSENRTVGNFYKISIAGGFKVFLKQDSSYTVKITADDNLLRYIKVSTNNGRLHIYTQRNLCNSRLMTVYVGVANLEEIKASGAVEVASAGKIRVNDLRFKLSGATRLTMDLTANNVSTSGSGLTELNLSGQAVSHDIDLSGSGKIHALDFVVSRCNIQTSGVGHCQVNVTNSLSVHSSGASQVRYRGNPSNVTNDNSGASSVEKIN